MSTAPTASPITLDRWEKSSNLAALAALASSGQVTLKPHEIIRTTDGRVYHWTTSALEIVSAPVHHGTVANPADLDGIYRLPSCTRGVHPCDTAFVTSAGCEYRVTSGINAMAVWAACATLPTVPTTPSEVGADPAGTAATAVSTHNTATDSHTDLRELIAGKQAALTISDVGTALLNLSTPASVQIPRINADGSVTLIDVPEGVGGCSARGLYSGLMSETIPSQSSTGLTTWVNQGAATVADVPLGLQVHHPSTASAGNICGLVCAAPTAPYELTALLELSSGSGQYPSALLGWADSASTKTHMVALCGDGRSGLIYAANYASWGFSSSNAPMFTREASRVWLRFADTGDSISVHWSHSGASWIQLYSSAKSSGHLGANGYNQLFFGVTNWGSPAVATLLSWSFGTADLPGSIVGHVVFKGQWDASSNDPALPDASESKGFYYITSAAGTYGGIDYGVGDWCISDGSTWGKVDNTDAVVSFNGRIGAILPVASDYAAHYLGLHAQAADSAMLGGQLPAYFAQASHTHNYAGSSSPGGAATTALECTGNSATATALAVARLINGTSFNGSSDVIVSKIYDENYIRIANPGGGTLLSHGTETGAIAIRLPNGFSNTMVSFSGFVYNYASNKSFTFSVHGYCYENGSWFGTSAHVSGFPEANLGVTVRFGRLADLSPVVYIGDLDSTWTYPQVSVNNVFCTWDGFSSAWTTGWQVTFESNAFMNVSAAATNCQVGYRPANAFTGAKVIGGTTYNFVNGLLVS